METLALPGDLVEVRRIAIDEPTEVAQGEVTAVDESSITLGTRPAYVYDEGWTYELIRRAPANLHLPETTSIIAAILVTDVSRPVVLVGRGLTWRSEDTAALVPVTDILSWEYHDDEEEGTPDGQ